MAAKQPKPPVTAIRMVLTVEVDPDVLEKSYALRMAQTSMSPPADLDIDALVAALEAKFSEKLPDILDAIKRSLGLP